MRKYSCQSVNQGSSALEYLPNMLTALGSILSAATKQPFWAEDMVKTRHWACKQHLSLCLLEPHGTGRGCQRGFQWSVRVLLAYQLNHCAFKTKTLCVKHYRNAMIKRWGLIYVLYNMQNKIALDPKLIVWTLLQLPSPKATSVPTFLFHFLLQALRALKE